MDTLGSKLPNHHPYTNKETFEEWTKTDHMANSKREAQTESISRCLHSPIACSTMPKRLISKHQATTEVYWNIRNEAIAKAGPTMSKHWENEEESSRYSLGKQNTVAMKDQGLL